MITPVVMPQMGLEVTEGTVAALHVTPGATVAPGDVLLELETDKATLEIESPVAGYVKRLLVRQGDAVDPGQAIAEIAEEGDA